MANILVLTTTIPTAKLTHWLTLVRAKKQGKLTLETKKNNSRQWQIYWF